ncbi:hypothetical protein F5148DRAFT_1289409 [Russula earlei]|uniref:Uncharacterized protein n=1 Tax=Russula earlei TaxID=71964 RepID=A0ACC0TXR9_9AGAM|nr:hypothetical protein F5148DRAFT_1289409 [Russula earlei]
MLSRAQYANIITSDIDHFWEAYDKIVSTTDSAQQYTYLDTLFLQKGTLGLAAMRQLRQYSAKSYIDAIHKYPLYWQAIRSKMFRVNEFSKAIEQNIAQLKQLYPALRPATIYFTVGAFRSGGTTLDSMVLIGSEIAMADEDMPTDEFVTTYSNMKANAKAAPVHRLVFTNVHEYVHTQQKSNNCDNLLGQSVMEGVAEFVAELATGMPSTAPALSYGPRHVDSVRTVFAQQLFNTTTSFWLYSDAQNVFGTRDLGYYVGHAICKSYYDKADNKKQAISEMIELDYNNDTALAGFVDQSGYFRKSIAACHEDYERSRPYVTGITELAGDTTAVSPALTTITIHFSEPLDKHYRNFELGPLGKEHILTLKAFKGFSEDGRSIVMEVEVAAGKHYQLVIGRGFRTLAGINLKPYLIDFTTGK